MSEIVKGGCEAPEVAALLSAANKEPPPREYRPLSDYGEVIHVLRNKKNMTYNDICVWFADRGLQFTPAHFGNAYKIWCALNPDKAKS